MKVFKFGGASVNSAEAVQNVTNILNDYKNEKILIVLSAMGKTTNLLEDLLNAYFNKAENLNSIFQSLKDFHYNIIDKLFTNKQHAVYGAIEDIFTLLQKEVSQEIPGAYNFEYDQIVGLGEIISTIIVSHYLQDTGFKSTYLDARSVIKTDYNYREANVDWKKTQSNVTQNVVPLFDSFNLIITQGFLGGTTNIDYKTTTLGREGSDYSAAIFAYCLNAQSMTIWKDVPGLMNADPKYFSKTTILEKIPYREAIELAYYGATIIHPKTIKPLENKKIPLHVKSFVNKNSVGSVIEERENQVPEIPSYIFKMKQKLLTISPKDFSFIRETDFCELFGIFAQMNIKINLMQNSAISFSVCIDENVNIFDELLQKLRMRFRVSYNENLELITIRHYTPAVIEEVVEGRPILLEQKSRLNAQIIIK